MDFVNSRRISQQVMSFVICNHIDSVHRASGALGLRLGVDSERRPRTHLVGTCISQRDDCIIKNHNLLFMSALAFVTTATFGLVFGNVLLWGEQIMSLVDTYFVLESVVFDVVLTLFILHLLAGIVSGILWVVMKSVLQDSPVGKRRRAALMYMLSTLGLILYTTGALVIGYQEPPWNQFLTISLALVAPGSGLLVWSSLFIAVSDDVSRLTSLRKLFLAASTPLFIAFFYPLFQTNDVFFQYKVVGTLCLPLIVVYIVLTFHDLVVQGWVAEPCENSQAVKIQDEAVSTRSIALIPLLKSLGFGLVSPSILGSTFLLPHYMQTQALSAVVIRDSIICASAGALCGRVVYLLVENRRVKLMNYRVFVSALGLSTVGGWYAQSLTSPVVPGSMEALAFFLGCAHGTLFFDLIMQSPRMICVSLTASIVALSTIRTSTGFMGAVPFDYAHFTLILMVISAVHVAYNGVLYFIN